MSFYRVNDEMDSILYGTSGQPVAPRHAQIREIDLDGLDAALWRRHSLSALVGSVHYRCDEAFAQSDTLFEFSAGREARRCATFQRALLDCAEWR